MKAPRALGLRAPRCFWTHEPPRSILQLVPSKASFCFCRFFVFFLNGAPNRIAKTHDLKPGCIRRRLPTIMQAACRTNCGIAEIHTLILSTDVQILRSRMSEQTINSKPPGVEIVSSNPNLPLDPGPYLDLSRLAIPSRMTCTAFGWSTLHPVGRRWRVAASGAEAL